MLQTFK